MRKEQGLAINRSDLGNAQRFAQQHRDKAMYCEGIGWLCFDGKRWCPIGEGIMRLAKDTIRSMYQEASGHGGEEDRKAIGEWALKSENAARIRAMVFLARAELLEPADALDRDPWLLNCANGTLDLRTAELRKHDPHDRITKLAPVNFNHNAQSALWEQVLAHALPDEEVQHFFRKLVGYTLTGCVGEDVFVLLHGPTRTSKGTVQGAIATMLGDYAITSELDALAERDRAGGPRPELTRLRGARMVSIYETSRHMKLAASLVKSLAGSDPITARTLHKEPFTFKPEGKIWIATNYLPHVPADDAALWERIRQIPFDVQLSEVKRDPTIRPRLQEPAHREAILAWATTGCLLWQGEGLRQPDAVRAAGHAYRSSMDPLQRFIDECCVLNPTRRIATADLRAEYETWCGEHGETPTTGDGLSRKLRDLGCETYRTNQSRGWKGIGVRGPLTLVKEVDGPAS